MTKLTKILAIVLVFAFIFIACVSCNQNVETTTNTQIDTTVIQTDKETTTKQTETETEELVTTSEEPIVNPGEKKENYDNEIMEVGSYVKLSFSKEFCDVTTSVKKGLGAQEEVTIEVTMKDGYTYTGITKDEYIDNYMELKFTDTTLTDAQKLEQTVLTRDTKVTFTTDKEMNLYVNYDVSVIYHLNGGVYIKDGEVQEGDGFIAKYPLSHYKCPVTVKAGIFTREGYVLSEYMIDNNGEEEYVSVGSRFVPHGSDLHVYCVWEKETDVVSFKYTKDTSSVTITGFTGEESDVVRPEFIEGLPVKKIAANAFTSSTIKSIFVPRTVTNIENKAFSCSNLERMTLHDGITSMQDGAFSNCKKFKSIRINTIHELFNDWCRATYNKMDRLLWAKDMKKIVIYGGSGSWYGWDCTELTKEFGDEYVIINLGMNANMCSCVFVEGVAGYMNEGDIFLWASEPGANLLGDTGFNSRTWWFIFSSYDIFRYVDISQYKNVFSTFANWNNEHATKPMSSRRSRVTDNIYGDDISVRENQFVTTSYRFSYFFSDYSHMDEVLTSMKDEGVKVLFTYAAMAKDCDGLDDAALEEYKQKLLQNFPIEIISDYHDCMYDNSLFWNSEWHMTLEGAHARTLNVIKDLKAYFENNK